MQRMGSSDSAADARRSWPIRRYRLGEEPSDDLSDMSTAEERLAMMWPLARDAWRLAGRELPAYTRAETPGRVIRNGRQR
jgi:hypothetical protein